MAVPVQNDCATALHASIMALGVAVCLGLAGRICTSQRAAVTLLLVIAAYFDFAAGTTVARVI